MLAHPGQKADYAPVIKKLSRAIEESLKKKSYSQNLQRNVRPELLSKES